MSQVNTTNANQASLGITICAAALITSIFMPWVSAFGFNVSGFDITKLGSYKSKYAGIGNAEIKLTRKVKQGGTGVWGSNAEPAHPDMAFDDIRIMVRAILFGNY